MKRNKREHGRILSVETLTRGDALAADVAAGVTSITVNDAGDFDEDGGWLYIGAQTVEYIDCDDDTGVITLATALTAAGEQGDPVHVWSDLYGEVVDYQQALVELDGEYDNPDPVVAEVAEGVGDLPEGDRGKAGESCTLKRVADDEWEVVGVGGRPRKSRGLRAEWDDFYTLTASDIAASSATFPLSHRPANEWVVAVWRTTPQRPTNYTVNYDAQTITWPLSGFEKAGDVLWVHYAYRKDFGRSFTIQFGAPDWLYKIIGRTDATDYSAAALDDSGWLVGSAAFGSDNQGNDDYDPWGGYKTAWPLDGRIWLRRHFGQVTSATVSIRVDNVADIYWNGTLVASHTLALGEDYNTPFVVDIPSNLLGSTNVLAVRATDDAATAPDAALIDVKVTGWGVPA